MKQLQSTNYRLRPSRGFTLIETLVAVMLLVSAIAGPLTIASKGLSTSLTAKDQVAAFYLAQDAVEYVRFTRDSNKLGGAAWLSGLEVCTSADGSASCYLDSTNNSPGAPVSCSGTCPVMAYTGSPLYRFGYGIGTPSQQRFVRTVKITAPAGGNADEAAIQVAVSWTGAVGGLHTVVVRENIFDW